MKRITKLLSCVLAGCMVMPFVACETNDVDSCEIGDLTINYTVNPVGIDNPSVFGWTMHDTVRGQKQTAYQIKVASFEKKLAEGVADVWDSGKVKSSVSVAVPYDGDAFDPMTRYYWTVTVWDKNGKEVKAKKPAYFETGVGLDGFSDAKWIQAQGAGNSAPMLRKGFDISGNIESARVYATSAGVYDLYLNGEKVGDAFLTPSWTEYDFRVMYQTYDVTDYLLSGGNAIGVMLGKGWYAGKISSYGGTNPAFICKLVITYTSGQTQTIVTDSSWTCYKNGPVTADDIYTGEKYDARKEVDGWCETGFSAQWTNAVETTAQALNMGAIVAQDIGNIVAMEELEPIEVTKAPDKDNAYIYDFGQNFSGVVSLTTSGTAGQTIALRHGEMLNDRTGTRTGDGPEGSLYTANLRSDNVRELMAYDTYTFADDEEVTWYPTFTYHGFRYLEVSGISEPIPVENVKGKVLYTQMESTMEFETSNMLINQLASNALWGQKSNFLSVPTDCPQRDERMGWSGDAQIFCGTAAYNMNVKTFYDNYITALNDCRITDGVSAGAYTDVAPGRKDMRYNYWNSGHGGWSDAGIIIPYTMYRRYGDTSMIEKYWDNMKAYIDYLVKDAGSDFIRDTQKVYGDWLAFENAYVGVTDTAWCVYACDLMAEMAEITGKTEDINRLRNYADKFREAWCKAYLEEDGTIKHGSVRVDVWNNGDWQNYNYDTQTTYVLGLYFGIIPEELAENAADALVAKIEANGNKLSTGFAGTSYLLPVLCKYGYEDVAFTLLEQEENPSWLFPVLQGATTIWERWDSYSLEKGFGDVSMNSFNHYSYGSVMEWVYSTVVGISNESPAFGEFTLKPTYGGSLTNAKGSYTSVYGKISSQWKLKGKTFEYTCTVPANTQATLYLPGNKGAAVTESGKNAIKGKADGVTYIGYENGRHVFKLAAGVYSFSSNI